MTTPTPDDLPPDAVPGLLEYSAVEQARRFAPPFGFAELVTTGALRQRRRRVQFQWAAGTALAASLAVAVTLFATGVFRSPDVPDVAVVIPSPPRPPEIVPPQTPGVRQQLSDAGEALSSLTRQTTEKAFAPTRTLLDSARATLPDPRPVPAEDPTTALAALPNAARTGLQPVTNTTRRAMNRLLKDVGFAN